MASLEEQEGQELKKRQRKVGLLFAVAVGFSVLFAYWMGAFGLGSSRLYYVTYNFAGGIESGSPVRLAGIKVGRVRNIEFSGEHGELLRLQIELRKDLSNTLTDDSQIYVNLAGLIGERYLEIVPGSGKNVDAGHSFRGIDPPRIDQIFSQGFGVFGDLRNFYTENKSDLKGLLVMMNDLTKNLNHLLASATPLERKQLSSLISNFSLMSDDLRATVSKLRKGTDYASERGAIKNWDAITSLLSKTDAIRLIDIRRLMLEDGVKVNLSSKQVKEER